MLTTKYFYKNFVHNFQCSIHKKCELIHVKKNIETNGPYRSPKKPGLLNKDMMIP